MVSGTVEDENGVRSAGASRWAYDGKGKPVNMPYWTIPERAVDDPEELAIWTRRAYEAAVRSKS